MFHSLYIHIPFCARKCPFCGFYSAPAPAAARAAYAELPAREWRERIRQLDLPRTEIRTVYFGGGTPAMLGAEGLARLAAGLRSVEPDLAPAEWTVEMNPAFSEDDLLKTLRAIGANRLSFGAQSFNDAVLKRCGRLHSAEMTRAAFRRARAAGFANLGLDLIAGLPGEDAASWRATLESALALEPEHLSVYALSIEPGTAFAREVAEGRWSPLGDDESADRLAATEECLAAAGFNRYEISNYARPGFACAYNVAVWRGKDYLGLGPSAASRIGSRRWTNPTVPAAFAPETLGELADAVERTLFRLRLAEGLDLEAAAREFPVLRETAARWRVVFEAFARQGIVIRRPDGAYALTRRGREVADAVMAECEEKVP